ncbi:MAG: transcriptional regulator [Chloroflexi bacterium HGW-Chloroflexi-1]|nr:MAG: transcriptional regulator [Chloroflexi bacterium HGW-Chloroflexi-1]
MPEISRFYGIIIKMYFDEHLPPHFHAEYGEHEGLVNINTLALISGKLPPRALGLTVEWASLHQEELAALWERARKMESLDKIVPLK